MSNAGQKQWTVMVYLAGDNDLDAAGITDLKEMKTVGSTRGVDVLAQVDRLGGGHATKRYHLQKGTSLDADAVDDLGETNMGDPAVLENFLRWGMKGYPAKKFLVILWNHGSGWDDEDIYRTARRDMGLGIRRRGQIVAPPSNGDEKTISVRRVRNVGGNRFRRALFNTTIKTAVSPGSRPRAIAFDDTSKDFLDNIETKKVLSKVTKELNRKIDILGMDACLMSMAEVAYQVRDSVRVTVGSEEVEPADGWPYDTILKELAAKPEMTPEQLAALIVAKYLISYPADANVTQAACDLGKCGNLAGVIDRLAKALTSGFSNANTRAAILESRIQVQTYEVPEYVDLYNFCELLRAKVPQGTVATACQKVMDAVRKPGFVLSSGYKGAAMQHSNGLAIYFPNKKISPLYGTLDFTKETTWGQFLEKYLKETSQGPRPAGRRSVARTSRRPDARA